MKKIIIRIAGGMVSEVYASDYEQYDVQIIDEDILTYCDPRYEKQIARSHADINEETRKMNVIY
jgi:site-specific DNA-adenine methylase